MTKLIKVGVTVAADDDVTTEDLRLILRTHLEKLPTQALVSTTDGPAPRIHWSSVDVRRLVERSVAAARPKPKKAAAQGEVP
jgi:hypothetical protein